MQNQLILMRRLLAAFCGAALIGACSFQPAPLTEQEQIEKIAQVIEAGGYAAARSYVIESHKENWSHDADALEVSITAPTEPGTYPLILYLPGLGEHVDAGRLWREYWAKAGYVVFALQATDIAEALADLKPALAGENGSESPEPAEDKGERRRSQSLRNDDLRYIGHQFFSERTLKTRVDHLLWAYTQFKQRANAGQGLFAKADLSHVFIAGYDIGAQTTTALIGEHTGIQLPQTTGFKPQAAILISPSVDPAMGNIGNRFKNIKLPLLVITSENDNDPYAISSPKVRTAVWEYAQSANGYLLLLKNAGHRLLAGSEWSRRAGPEYGGYRAEQWMPGFTNNLDGGARSRHRPNGAGRGMSSHSQRQAKVEAYRSVAAVFSVSTAFLDGIGKADNFARLWLTEKATVWLDDAATLKIK